MGFVGNTGWDALGSTCNLFLGWSSRVDVSVISVDANVIFCKVNYELNVDFYFVFVYGCPYIYGRNLVQDRISSLMKNNSWKTMLIGDKNQLEDNSQNWVEEVMSKGLLIYLLKKRMWDF